jgi:cytochrome c-type biogenesis protein
MDIGHLVVSGPLLLAIPLALAAGAITFLSPCCLPLVPGYLSYVTGMSGSDAERARAANGQATAVPGEALRESRVLVAAGAATAQAGGMTAALPPGPAGATAAAAVPATGLGAGGSKGRTIAGTLLFVLGFSLVFASYGTLIGGLGQLLRTHNAGLTQILGGFTVVLGLLFAGAFDRFSFAGRAFRPAARPRAGLAGAPVLGVLFGVGWSPCLGPTLAAVLTLSAASDTAGRGAFLAFVYGLGLGIPFLLVSLAFQRMMTMLGFFRRHARLVTRIGGAMLIGMGLLEVTGAWTFVDNWLRANWIADYNLPI